MSLVLAAAMQLLIHPLAADTVRYQVRVDASSSVVLPGTATPHLQRIVTAGSIRVVTGGDSIRVIIDSLSFSTTGMSFTDPDIASNARGMVFTTAASPHGVVSIAFKSARANSAATEMQSVFGFLVGIGNGGTDTATFVTSDSASSTSVIRTAHWSGDTARFRETINSSDRDGGLASETTGTWTLTQTGTDVTRIDVRAVGAQQLDTSSGVIPIQLELEMIAIRQPGPPPR